MVLTINEPVLVSNNKVSNKLNLLLSESGLFYIPDSTSKPSLIERFRLIISAAAIDRFSWLFFNISHYFLGSGLETTTRTLERFLNLVFDLLLFFQPVPLTRSWLAREVFPSLFTVKKMIAIFAAWIFYTSQ